MRTYKVNLKDGVKKAFGKVKGVKVRLVAKSSKATKGANKAKNK